MTSNDPKAVVVRYVEAARDGMSAVIRDSFAEDATWDYPGDLPLSGTYRGIDAIVNEFLAGAAALMAPGAGVVIKLTNVVAEGDQVVAEWTSRATARNGGPTTTATQGSLPSGTARSFRCVSTPTLSMSPGPCSPSTRLDSVAGGRAQ
jgi:ketosteroid isomerase-like protein